MTGKEIKANFAHLKGAFTKHGAIADTGTNISHHLLRYYANECGLKALFIRENQLDHTGEFAQKMGMKKYGHGHDLLRWIDELKIPGFAINFSDKINDPLVQLHEKLRYGVGSDNTQTAFLCTLHSLIKKRL